LKDRCTCRHSLKCRAGRFALAAATPTAGNIVLQKKTGLRIVNMLRSVTA
jgi:hypothetical protein